MGEIFYYFKVGKVFLNMILKLEIIERKCYYVKVKNICMVKKRNWNDNDEKEVEGFIFIKYDVL